MEVLIGLSAIALTIIVVRAMKGGREIEADDYEKRSNIDMIQKHTGSYTPSDAKGIRAMVKREQERKKGKR